MYENINSNTAISYILGKNYMNFFSKFKKNIRNLKTNVFRISISPHLKEISILIQLIPLARELSCQNNVETNKNVDVNEQWKQHAMFRG